MQLNIIINTLKIIHFYKSSLNLGSRKINKYTTAQTGLTHTHTRPVGGATNWSDWVLNSQTPGPPSPQMSQNSRAISLITMKMSH